MTAKASCVDCADTPGVLLVAEGNGSGGINRYCLDLAEILGPAAAITCLCADSVTGCGDCWLRCHCASRGVPLVAVPMGPREWKQGCGGVAALWRLANRPLVHTNGRRGNYIAQTLRVGLRGFSFVTAVHGVLGLHYRRNAAYRLVDLAAGRSAAAVIAVSADTRRRLIRMGSPVSKTLHIPNGLRAKDLDVLNRVGVGRLEAANSDAPVRVGFLGRLSREKGIEDFVRIARLLRSRTSHVEFTVAGDGPLEDLMIEGMRELECAGVFKYLGEAQSPEEMLREVDVLVMPSHNEGLPYVLLEGMAAGCAVSAYGVGGIPEVISDNSLGMLARPGDVEGLFRGVLQLTQRPELAYQMGVRASKHVGEHFRLEERLPALLAAYGMARPVCRGPLDLGPSQGGFTRCA
jgi:glycosyltransferase involved in cell wall biosynthesis